LQFVNEARRKAEAFGDIELIGPHAYDEGADAGLVAGWDGEKRDDLVLTTNARIGGQEQEGEMDEVENRPRGFFADQVRRQ
jgi:cysteine synthase A